MVGSNDFIGIGVECLAFLCCSNILPLGARSVPNDGGGVCMMIDDRGLFRSRLDNSFRFFVKTTFSTCCPGSFWVDTRFQPSIPFPIFVTPNDTPFFK